MAASLVRQFTPAGGTANPVLTVPSGGADVGDLVVICAQSNVNPPTAYTDTRSNTWTAGTLSSSNTGGCRLYWSRITTALQAGDSVTPTGGGGNCATDAAVFTGITSGTVDKQVVEGAASGTTWNVGPSAALSQASELVVCAMGAEASVTVTVDAAYTLLSSSSFTGPVTVGWGFKVVNTTAAQSADFTDTSIAHDGAMATFLATSDVAIPPLFPLIPRLRMFKKGGQDQPFFPFAKFPAPEVAAGNVYQKDGSITAGVTVSGPDVFEAAETGSLTTRAMFSGADVFEATETGSLATRALPSGADVFTASETGSLTTRVLGSGADVFTAVEAGTVPVGTILSGVSVYVPTGPATYVKAGSLTAAVLASGQDVFEHNETGSLLTRPLLSGADTATVNRAGSLLVGTRPAGATEFVPFVVLRLPPARSSQRGTVEGDERGRFSSTSRGSVSSAQRGKVRVK